MALGIQEARTITQLSAYGDRGRSNFNSAAPFSAYWFVAQPQEGNNLYLVRSQWPTVVEVLQRVLGVQVDGKFGDQTLNRLHEEMVRCGVDPVNIVRDQLSFSDLEWALTLAFGVGQRMGTVTPEQISRDIRPHYALPHSSAVTLPQSGASVRGVFGPVSSQRYATPVEARLFSTGGELTSQGRAAGVQMPAATGGSSSSTSGTSTAGSSTSGSSTTAVSPQVSPPPAATDTSTSTRQETTTGGSTAGAGTSAGTGTQPATGTSTGLSLGTRTALVFAGILGVGGLGLAAWSVARPGGRKSNPRRR